MAKQKASGLLDHDEAISLLMAAGKAPRMSELYAGMGGIQVLRAGDLQNLLRPTGDDTTRDGVRSLAKSDIHPPLYFLILRGMQSLRITSPALLRMFGTLVLCIAGYIAHRWIWPEACGAAKLLGLAWLLINPLTVDIATELRQYAIVYLGVIISVAALIALWEDRSPRRHTVMLLALAPVVLLWSQYGAAVWVFICLLTALAGLPGGNRHRWKLLICSVAAAAVMLAPLLLWGLGNILARPTPIRIPLSSIWANAVQPICGGVANAWYTLPWAWKGAAGTTAVTVVLLTTATLLAWHRGKTIDRAAACAALGWCIAWLLLLVLGHLPLHASEPKHLTPLLVVPLCLIVRAASPTRPTWTRRAALGFLSLSLATHVLGIWQMSAPPADQQMLAALARAECLLVNAPRRGYLLPLVEKMDPNGRVIIADPRLSGAPWGELSDFLPDNRLILVEIGSRYTNPRDRAGQELFDRLSRMYRYTTPMREGPERTVTEFSQRLTMLDANWEDPHG